MYRTSSKPIWLARSAYWYLRFPKNCYGCYRGIFETSEQAIAAAPKSKKIGYDHADLAQEYQEQLSKEIGSYDYPLLFWLKDLLTEESTLFDFGGNVGTHFYAYAKYLNYPKNLKWVVCELPAIIAAGEALAKRENQSAIYFTDQLNKAEEADIFLASGAIQYLESFSSQLANLKKLPPYLLINRLPVCQGKSFVTLQNGGLVYYPVYVKNKLEFTQSIAQLGYELIDTWQDRSEPCSVPFHPEFSSMSFNGFYFRLQPPSK